MSSDQRKMNSSMVKVLQKIIRNLKNKDILQSDLQYSLLIYLFKAGEFDGYLKRVFQYQSKFGLAVLPRTFKCVIKYFIRHFVKKNNTTSELEKVWI